LYSTRTFSFVLHVYLPRDLPAVPSNEGPEAFEAPDRDEIALVAFAIEQPATIVNEIICRSTAQT
jgi:hypothetical protein